MLNTYRDEISQLDDEIIKLLERRFEVTQDVGKFKKTNSIEILNESREQLIMDKIKGLGLNHETSIVDVYTYLMLVSKKQQEDLC